ncbi:MAG: DEAD/DEAH box helicase, partial [Rhodospirillaceae bacterium]|nr:DEAD/DEAH box helicase [Rhodospirillaceae bacterium]
DRMLDMGFIPDVEKIVKLLPPIRQTLFFSATMAPEIKKLADRFLMNPKEISVSAPASASEMIIQGISILKVPSHVRGMDAKKKLKCDALRALIEHEEVKDAIIFCNRKIDITTVYKSLSSHGFQVGQLHGDMSQPARTEMLANFKAKKFNILVCSDVAARGLDIPDLSHVFNYDVPMRDEDYVHRIGRTGRAGREGHAFSIALPEDGKYISAIEALIGTTIPRIQIPAFDEGKAEQGGGREARGGRRPGANPAKREDKKANQKDGAKKPRRRGGRGRNNPATDNSAKPETKPEVKVEAKAEAKAETKTESAPQPEKKSSEKKPSERNSHGEKKPGHGSEDEGSGLGGTDHMPAFLKGS